jgi:hypothetical protein
VHRIEELAAVLDERPDDLLERGVIWRRGVPEMDADSREPLAGRRDGPLDQRRSRLLKGAEQLRPFDKLRAAPSRVEGWRERQRNAGAQGHAEKITT